MKKPLRIILYGFLAWLIPFVISIFFYSMSGKLIVDVFLFKSIMIAVGSVTAANLLVAYFKKIDKDYLEEGMILGLTWFAVNIGLDLLVLVPMSGMTIENYCMQIGLRYLVIPTMCIMVGVILENKKGDAV